MSRVSQDAQAFHTGVRRALYDKNEIHIVELKYTCLSDASLKAKNNNKKKMYIESRESQENHLML